MTPPTRVIGRRAKPPYTEIYCMKFAGWCQRLVRSGHPDGIIDQESLAGLAIQLIRVKQNMPPCSLGSY